MASSNGPGGTDGCWGDSASAAAAPAQSFSAAEAPAPSGVAAPSTRRKLRMMSKQSASVHDNDASPRQWVPPTGARAVMDYLPPDASLSSDIPSPRLTDSPRLDDLLPSHALLPAPVPLAPPAQLLTTAPHTPSSELQPPPPPSSSQSIPAASSAPLPKPPLATVSQLLLSSPAPAPAATEGQLMQRANSRLLLRAASSSITAPMTEAAVASNVARRMSSGTRRSVSQAHATAVERRASVREIANDALTTTMTLNILTAVGVELEVDARVTQYYAWTCTVTHSLMRTCTRTAWLLISLLADHLDGRGASRWRVSRSGSSSTSQDSTPNVPTIAARPSGAPLCRDAAAGLPCTCRRACRSTLECVRLPCRGYLRLIRLHGCGRALAVLPVARWFCLLR